MSYKLTSRSGNEAEFRDMVQRCNNAGVRIYVDAVINHMSAVGGASTAGSPYSVGSQSYPDAGFSRNDFNDANCRTASGNIENYGDVNQVISIFFIKKESFYRNSLVFVGEKL